MTARLLICTDLDRTLIPNGPEPESRGARNYFARLVTRDEVSLAYVSGRHRALVEQAMVNYGLPVPDFVIGDVGTTIYHVGSDGRWRYEQNWEDEIARDWNGKTHDDLRQLLQDIKELRLQEHAKQNRCKLSYYLPVYCDQDALAEIIQARFSLDGIKARLIWSVDEPAGVGLLDVLPARASKYHAIEALMRMQKYNVKNTIFCGDSGNDIEVLASPVPAVLVANSQPQVRELARRLVHDAGYPEQLYIARGDFMGMNGYYSAGMLEGIAHYFPHTLAWMGLDREGATV